MMHKFIPIASRSCGECAKCCEGWLHGSAHDHAFYKGMPCFYLEKTCTIYDNRPVNPCQTYKCAWLAEDIFPMWMKPHLVNAIITRRVNGDIVYYEIVEAGGILQAATLNWLVQWALNTNNNISYHINGGANKVGTQEILKLNI